MGSTNICAVDYLFKAHDTNHSARPSAAIAIVAVYSILLLLLAITYFRLLYTVTTNPGFVPRGARWHKKHVAEQEARSQIRRHKRSPDKEDSFNVHRLAADNNNGYAYADGPPAVEAADGQATSTNLRDFYSKYVFSCEGDGRPIWCSTCLNFKPDRAHHCREVGRCVLKMDHFCPW